MPKSFSSTTNPAHTKNGLLIEDWTSDDSRLSLFHKILATYAQPQIGYVKSKTQKTGLQALGAPQDSTVPALTREAFAPGAALA